METKITTYQRCQCGAVTVWFENGASNSMYEKTRKKYGLNLRGVKRLQDSYCCNHCVNHYGIDLCECGSGEEVGKCDCGSNKAMEELGIKFDSFAKIIENFRKYW